MERRKLLLVIIFIMLALVMLVLHARDKSHRLKLLKQASAIVKQHPSRPVAPLPKFQSYQPINYNAANLRDPFQPLSLTEKSGLSRGQRLIAPLEKFNLDVLHMVGVVTSSAKTWALIAAPDGKVYKVGLGDYIGQHDGRIVAITGHFVELVEQRQQGQKYYLQSVTLFLGATHSATGSKAN